MRILVTGSAGLVGTDLCQALRARGDEVVEYDIAHDPAFDICDRVALTLVMAGCDGVIHLAAISRVAWGEADPALTHSVNVTGTETVLDVALAQPDVPWVLFISSREVYGDPEVQPIAEDAPIAPLNHYGRSKAEGEVLMQAARDQGLIGAIVRLSNVYGTLRDHPDRAVPSLLWRALQGHELQITGASNFFDFVHVSDCVRGIILLADRLAAGARDLPPLHLATGRATSLQQLAAVALQMGADGASVTVLPPRSFDVAGFCGDPARARDVLGWLARIELADGMRDLAGLMRARGRPLDAVEMPRPR